MEIGEGKAGSERGNTAGKGGTKIPLDVWTSLWESAAALRPNQTLPASRIFPKRVAFCRFLQGFSLHVEHFVCCPNAGSEDKYTI